MKEFPTCFDKKITIIAVPQKTLNMILEKELRDIINIDILKIDIEGGELKCLKGLDFDKYKPKIILLENICKNNAINLYLFSKGYRLDKEISYNQFYILNE